MAQTRIFVSHSPKDEGITRRLVEDLRRAGAEVWVDWASDDFTQHIDEALAQSDWVVLVLSPNAIASSHVRAEVDAALHLIVYRRPMRRVILFAVARLAPGTMPPEWDIPRRYDATRDYAGALAELLVELGLLPPASTAPQYPRQEAPVASSEPLSEAPPLPPVSPPAPAAPAPEGTFSAAPDSTYGTTPAQIPSSTGGLPSVHSPPNAQPYPSQPSSPSTFRTRGDEESAAKRSAPPSTATLQFSAYHPNALAVETWNTLLVYTYIAEVLAQVEADAATFTELGSAPSIVQGQSTQAVARGVELTIEPHMDGVTFSPTSDTFIWRDSWRRSLFRFSGAAALAGTEQHGWIDIYAHPMVPLAHIDLTFRFHETRLQQLATSHPQGMMVTSNIYDSVFISYSHRDTEAFRQACNAYHHFGITIYTDEQLEAGAHYEDELSQMIAVAKVFHLLWSGHSAVSTECRKEWLAALQREPSERFIKPWFWNQPLIPPPSEFTQHRISFKYEPLKRSIWRPGTWF